VHSSAQPQITRIKEKVEEQSGVPPPQQRLIFGGRQLCVRFAFVPKRAD
jgi:hypothetical protein